MKLFILKLLSLIVCCVGLISLGVALGLPEVQTYLLDPGAEFLVSLQDKLPPRLDFLKGALTLQGLWFGGSVVAIVLGIYGFFPQFAKYRRKKKIAYEGPHGEVEIYLDSVEQSLNQVIARMPEIKRSELQVVPQDNGRKALIRANVVINQQPGQNARAIAGLVSDYIAESATKLLGLEELANIELKVTGINVNTRKSSKAIRKESLSHSANAPVELLEAAPSPLTLSGPGGGDPLGSEPIEEEIDEEAESEDSYDTSAVDTRKEEANQAAARSELLEPLNMGEAAAEDTPDQAPAESTPERDEPALDRRDSDAVAPADMDGLGESLADTADELVEEPIEDDFEGWKPESAPADRPAPAAAEDAETPFAADGDTDTAAPAPSYTAENEAAGKDSADERFGFDFTPETRDEAPEAMESVSPGESEESSEAVHPYPWERPVAATEFASDSDTLETEQADTPSDVPDAESGDSVDTGDTDDTRNPEQADSFFGEDTGEVTIPEDEDEDTPPEEAEKKRWGGWFR